MCVYSVVTDDAFRRWHLPWQEFDNNGNGIWKLPKLPKPSPSEVFPPLLPPDYLKDLPSKTEVLELIELLKAAKNYDNNTGQPKCENETKKKILRDIATQLGIEIEIP